MPNCGGKLEWRTMQNSEEGIERSISPHQYCLGGQGSIEKAQTHWINERICQGIQFLDVGHKEHKSKSEGGKKAKVKGKTSKKSGWKKQNKAAARGKLVEDTTKLVHPHRAKDCPKREKLSTLVTVNDKGESDLETPPRVNPLQLLNVKASVDSGATHNFVATREATRLGLKLEEDTSRIKAVNSEAQKI
ncbi:hypothetical protein AAG906_020862 [Vitis piasezkii]